MRKLLVPFLALSVYLPQQPAMQVTQPVLEEGKDRYCSATLTWPDDGKPYPAMIHLKQIDKNMLSVETGKKNPYPFPADTPSEKLWTYTTDNVVMILNGGVFGDDPADSFNFKRKHTGWNVEANKSDIGDKEKAVLDSTLGACKK